MTVRPDTATARVARRRVDCVRDHIRGPVGTDRNGCDVLGVMTTTDAPALTVYSTTWCGYCKRLKKQLDEYGFFFFYF